MTHEEFIKECLTGIKWHIKDGILYVDQNLDLWLEYYKFKELPDNLTINGYLDAVRRQINKLPNNLIIKSWLSIRSTEITELPEGLFVGGSLYIEDTKIDKIPKNIHVGGHILINKGKKLIIEDQEDYISKNKLAITHIKDPTEKAKTLHKLLWEI